MQVEMIGNTPSSPEDIERAFAAMQDAQSAFWSAMGQFEAIADVEVDSTEDLENFGDAEEYLASLNTGLMRPAGLILDVPVTRIHQIKL